MSDRDIVLGFLPESYENLHRVTELLDIPAILRSADVTPGGLARR